MLTFSRHRFYKNIGCFPPWGISPVYFVERDVKTITRTFSIGIHCSFTTHRKLNRSFQPDVTVGTDTKRTPTATALSTMHKSNFAVFHLNLATSLLRTNLLSTVAVSLRHKNKRKLNTSNHIFIFKSVVYSSILFMFCRCLSIIRRPLVLKFKHCFNSKRFLWHHFYDLWWTNGQLSESKLIRII